MSWQKNLAKLVTEFGDDVVERVKAVLPGDATPAQARKAAQQIAKPAESKPVPKRAASSAKPKAEKPLAAKPKAKPSSRATVFSDEEQWKLPADFGKSVDIVTTGPAIIQRQKPVTTWHGTPHVFAAERKVQTPTGEEVFIAGAPDVLPDVPSEFSVLKDYPLGRFRSERLGSGEGAQQYGIGTYVAENPEVARNYRNELTVDAEPPSIGGVPLEAVYSQLQRRADMTDPTRAEAMYDRLSALEDLGLHGDIRGVLDRAREGAYLRDTMDWFNREIVPKYRAPGALYQVDLAADPREFLDYDAPLSLQTDAVRRAIAEMDLSHLGEGNRSRVMLERFLKNEEQPTYLATGQTLLSALPHSPDLEHTAQGSRYLLEKGIPGVRYWDEGSRGTRRGTSNYVVFDPEGTLTIKERFARGGSVAELAGKYGC